LKKFSLKSRSRSIDQVSRELIKIPFFQAAETGIIFLREIKIETATALRMSNAQAR
jgi:hypothetical protein